MNVTKEQWKIFRQAFSKIKIGTISLPKKVNFDKITEIEFYTEGMRGGYKVRFFIKMNEQGKLFLDFFASSDYLSQHKRIEFDGSIIDLENYKSLSCDETKIENQLHNTKVKEILMAKGLERNYDNPEFEEKFVDRHVNYWGTL